MLNELRMCAERSTELFEKSGSYSHLHGLNHVLHPVAYLKHCRSRTQDHCSTAVSNFEQLTVCFCDIPSFHSDYAWSRSLRYLTSGLFPESVPCLSLQLIFCSCDTDLCLAPVMLSSSKSVSLLPAHCQCLPVWPHSCHLLPQGLLWHLAQVPVLQLLFYCKFHFFCFPGLTTGTRDTLCPVLPCHQSLGANRTRSVRVSPLISLASTSTWLVLYRFYWYHKNHLFLDAQYRTKDF